MPNENLRGLIRAFVLSPQVVEIIGEDGAAAVAALVAEPPIKPHVVKLKDVYEDVPDDPIEGDHRKGVRKSAPRYVGPAHCPDCTRGLVARPDGLLTCERVPYTFVPDKPGGTLVACGMTEDATDG